MEDLKAKHAGLRAICNRADSIVGRRGRRGGNIEVNALLIFLELEDRARKLELWQPRYPSEYDRSISSQIEI